VGKRSIIFFWLLLLIPTLLVAAGAFRLLRHEQARLDTVRVSAARDRGGALADSLQITLSEIKEMLLVSLQAVEPERLVETLGAWEAENYLVRNVFVWEPDKGLVFPEPGAGTTNEEKSFINRYDALFSGRFGWPAVAGSDTVSTPAMAAKLPGQHDLAAQLDKEQKPSPLVESIEEMKKSRRRMVRVAKSAPQTGAADEVFNEPEPSRGGWIPWFEENRLHILGWLQKTPGSPVYGLELELMALLSRMVSEFSSISEADTVYALVDGSGRILYQSIGTPVASQDKPELSVSLSPQLPHWQVAVFFTGSRSTKTSRGGLLMLSSLLLGIFVVAILSGGGLLTWQALRNLKDARQKTSFVSNVSHELKTPLTSIMMYAELLLEGRVASHAKKDHYLKVIVDESRRLTRLVNNVLDFSRLEQGKKTYNRGTLDIGRYLKDMAGLHRVRLKETSMDLELNAKEDRFFSEIDRDAFDQVMMNLIDNAIKYAGEGGYIGITLCAEKGMHVIRVDDRGPGIPLDFQSRLFGKFQRADDSLTTSKPGSGLGLSIARQLARDHGGDIRFEPAAGRGSCFIISLPTGGKSDGT